jgi:hypothetical protein
VTRMGKPGVGHLAALERPRQRHVLAARHIVTIP